MFLSKHSLLCYSFTLVAAAGLIKHTIAEDGVRTNFHRDDFAFDEAIPLELEEMPMEEVSLQHDC